MDNEADTYGATVIANTINTADGANIISGGGTVNGSDNISADDIANGVSIASADYTANAANTEIVTNTANRANTVIARTANDTKAANAIHSINSINTTESANTDVAENAPNAANATNAANAPNGEKSTNAINTTQLPSPVILQDPTEIYTEGGYIPSPVKVEKAIYPFEGNLYKSSILPKQYDLRDYGYVTPVRNQGSLGTCWTFSTYGSLESTVKRLGGEEYDFSEIHMAVHNGVTKPNEGGNNYIASAYLVSGKGPILETQIPILIHLRLKILLLERAWNRNIGYKILYFYLLGLILWIMTK